jgi:hypothetical protein
MVHGVNNFFDNIQASAERYNIPHEIFRSADALRSRFPQFAVNGTEVGFLDKGGGYLFLEACIRTQLRSAEDYGAELKFGDKVVTFNSSASGVTVTTDSGERYDAERLLLAVGAWTPRFLPERLRQYFSVTRQFLHWFEIQTNPERFSKDCPVFIWEVNRKSILYGFPLVGEQGAGLKVANEESEGIVDPDSVDRVVSEADKAKMYETYVRPFLPDLGPRSIKTAVCLYTNAPGARFVIDKLPEHERVIFASPCSGHGFKVHDVDREVEHVLWDFLIFDSFEIIVGQAYLIGIPQRHADHAFVARFKCDYVFSRSEDDLPECNHPLLANGFPDHRERLLSDFAIRDDEVWVAQIQLVDLRLRDELINVNDALMP